MLLNAKSLVFVVVNVLRVDARKLCSTLKGIAVCMFLRSDFERGSQTKKENKRVAISRGGSSNSSTLPRWGLGRVGSGPLPRRTSCASGPRRHRWGNGRSQGCGRRPAVWPRT